MKKALFVFALMGMLVSCNGTVENPEKNNSTIKEPEMDFGQTTKAALIEEQGQPETQVDTTLKAEVSFIQNLVMNFTSPYGTSNFTVVDRKVSVLKYEGETEDEVCRVYVFLNDELAGSIVVYNKNSSQYTEEVEAYLDSSSRNYLAIKMQNIYNVFKFDSSDVDEDHQYLLTWLNSSLYIAQQESPDPDASHAENWLRTATGYNIVAYGGVPAKNPANEYSMLTYVDVRAIYEFAHFSDVFGFLDFVLDMTF